MALRSVPADTPRSNRFSKLFLHDRRAVEQFTKKTAKIRNKKE